MSGRFESHIDAGLIVEWWVVPGQFTTFLRYHVGPWLQLPHLFGTASATVRNEVKRIKKKKKKTEPEKKQGNNHAIGEISPPGWEGSKSGKQEDIFPSACSASAC